jgi:acetyl-CoA C-acetyltransferase
MPKITSSASLEMPYSPQEVWAVAGDFTNYGQWSKLHVAFPDGVPLLAQGTKYRERVSIMGMPGEAEWEVTEVEAPRRYVMTGSAMAGIELRSSLILTGSDAGVSVALEMTLEGGVIPAGVGMAVTKAGKKAVAQSLEGLSRCVAQRKAQLG